MVLPIHLLTHSLTHSLTQMTVDQGACGKPAAPARSLPINSPHWQRTLASSETFAMCLVLHFRFPDGFSEFSRQAGSSRLFGRKPFGESEIPWALLGKRRFLFLRRCSELWEEVFCLRAFKSEGKKQERMDVREMEHRKAMPSSKMNQKALGSQISVLSCVTISYPCLVWCRQRH